jgi:hypothetical protein
MFIFLLFYLSIMTTYNEDYIYKDWIHSHEEDTEDKKKFIDRLLLNFHSHVEEMVLRLEKMANLFYTLWDL